MRTKVAFSVLGGLAFGLLVLVAFRFVLTQAGRQAARWVVGDFFSGAEDFDEEAQPWIACSVPLPDGHAPLVFLRRHIHPFLAEYDRKVTLTAEDGREVVRWLPTNPGGDTMVNLYWYQRADGEGPLLRLQDHWGVYAVDLQRETVSLVRERNGVAYVGEIPAGSKGNISSGWFKEDGGDEWTFTVAGNEGARATGPLAHGKGRYIGRLDSRDGPPRFMSAAQSPEEPITPVN